MKLIVFATSFLLLDEFEVVLDEEIATAHGACTNPHQDDSHGYYVIHVVPYIYSITRTPTGLHTYEHIVPPSLLRPVQRLDVRDWTHRYNPVRIDL